MALEIHGRRTEGYSAFIEKLKSCFDTVEVGYNIVFAKNKTIQKLKIIFVLFVILLQC